MEYVKDEKISVLLVKHDSCPKMVEISNSIQDMQKLVGGLIEEWLVYDDDVAIVFNERGKLLDLPLNRKFENDIIRGDFFICYSPLESEYYHSLPENLAKKYMKKFEMPEFEWLTPFQMTNDAIDFLLKNNFRIDHEVFAEWADEKYIAVVKKIMPENSELFKKLKQVADKKTCNPENFTYEYLVKAVAGFKEAWEKNR